MHLARILSNPLTNRLLSINRKASKAYIGTLYTSKFNSFSSDSKSSKTPNNITITNMSSSRKMQPTDNLQKEGESVWNEFIQLALEYKPLNLGQGLPDYREAAPDHVKENLVKAATGPNFMLNQYTRGYGHPRLVNAISQFYSPLVNAEIDPKTEVLITIGAYESIFCIINAFIQAKDQAVIIEPFFDCYEPMVRLLNGQCHFVPLKLNKEGYKGQEKRDNSSQNVTSSADWILDFEELESKCAGAQLLILNNPHNPSGKVFSEYELKEIARIAIKHNLIVLSDEVYEHLVIDGKHLRIASLPGMWDRTITVGSAGKTFSVTGWKLGWCYGPKKLMKWVQTFHQNCIYTCPTIIQEAVAESLEREIVLKDTPESYWRQLAESLKHKRDMMVEVLTKANMDPTIPEAGYFLMANTSQISKKYDFQAESGNTKDHKFTRYLSKNKGLQGIPPSAFYSSEHKILAQDLIRLCYFKSDSTLKEAEKLIQNL